MLRVYVDADVLFRAATASHEHTAALVLLRMAEFTLLREYQNQAHWKDVINLAAAAQAQASILVTYNTRHYYPQAALAARGIQVMTPGELVEKARTALAAALG